MKKFPAWTASLAACLTLVACFGGLKSGMPVPVNYRISAPKLAAAAPVEADLQVSVESTAPGLDGTGIAARFPDSRLDYLAGSRWPVRLPALIESALIEGLQDAGQLRSVQGDFSRFRSTHSLALEVRRFEADYTGGDVPTARVALAVTVGRQSDRRVIASFTVAAEQRAAENRVSSVVAALDAAFGKVAVEAAEKSIEAISRDLAAPQPSANIRS